MAPSVIERGVQDYLTDRDWRVSNTTATLPQRATLTDTPAHRRRLRSSFDCGQFVVETADPEPAWIGPTLQSLAEVLRLRPNWDTYGGNPVDPRCAEAALGLAFRTLRDDTAAPSIVPTSPGGLQLEWHAGGVDLEIEFLSPTRICGIFEDHVAGTSWEKDLTFDESPLIGAIAALSGQR